MLKKRAKKGPNRIIKDRKIGDIETLFERAITSVIIIILNIKLVVIEIKTYHWKNTETKLNLT